MKFYVFVANRTHFSPLLHQGEPSQSTELVAEALKETNIDMEHGKTAAADSLLPIMHGQRERYRQRAQELETVIYLSATFRQFSRTLLLLWHHVDLCFFRHS